MKDNIIFCKKFIIAHLEVGGQIKPHSVCKKCKQTIIGKKIQIKNDKKIVVETDVSYECKDGITNLDILLSSVSDIVNIILAINIVEDSKITIHNLDFDLYEFSPVEINTKKEYIGKILVLNNIRDDVYCFRCKN